MSGRIKKIPLPTPKYTPIARNTALNGIFVIVRKNMKIWFAGLSLLLSISLFFHSDMVNAAETITIRLSGPASMNNALKEIIAQYTARHKRIQVLTNIGASGAMAKQIKEGAPADIFISANPKWMAFLRDNQLIDSVSERILVHNTLVFVGKENPKVRGMADLPVLKRIAMGSPQSVPAGEYAAEAMKNAGIYAILEKKQILVMAKDVRQALAYADRGETDGAFVYKTDALIASHAVILFEVPADQHAAITYPIALTVDGAKKEEARAFCDYLRSEDGLRIFAKYGFGKEKK